MGVWSRSLRVLLPRLAWRTQRLLPPPWYDGAEAAADAARRAGNDPLLRQVGEAIVRDGFAILPGVVDPALCDATVRDFGRVSQRWAADPGVRDRDGR